MQQVHGGEVLKGFWVNQADATLITTTPVSGTKYTVLPLTSNVRIISISIIITWAVTQPDPIEVWLTVGGVSKRFYRVDAVSGTDYYCDRISPQDDAQILQSSSTGSNYRAFLSEDKSVKVEHEVTWATTQPTNLTTRIKYARYI